MAMLDQFRRRQLSDQPVVDAELRCIEVARTEQRYDNAALVHLLHDTGELVAVGDLVETAAGQNQAGHPMLPKLTAIFQLQQRIALHVADHRHHRMMRGLRVAGHRFGDLSVIRIQHVAGHQANQRRAAAS